jgi:ABC-type spermidine/putrescine transport system permease subunit II
LTVPVLASILPEELTALRITGLVFAVALIAFAVWRRHALSNGAVLLAIFGGIALAIVSGTELLDAFLSAFAFEEGNGGRILGLAVFAIAILFLLVLRALTETARMNEQLSALLEGLAWEEFR